MFDRPAYVNAILRFADAPLVKVITGIRRSGKSTILLMLMEALKKRGVPAERISSYRFDSMKYDGLTAKALYEMLLAAAGGGRTYIFLDEVQEIAGWEKVVNSLMQEADVDIYVTGSNSRMMSSEISTYLTGRYVSFEIYPLSFAEYLTFKGRYADVQAPRLELPRYIQYGGFPVVHLQDYARDDAYTIVHDIYNTVIFTDIVRRNEIRKVDQLERVVKYTFSNVGNTFSAASIAKYLKSERRALDEETVYAYLEKLEKAFLLHRCSRYDLKGKEPLKTQEKFYLADPALLYAVLGYDPNTVAAMLENVVYLELRRRGYAVNIGKTPNGEVDFVASKQNDKLYVQVAERIVEPATQKREFDRLLEIRDNYPKYVLRTDDFADGNHEGIRVMHVADFLLSDAY
ncbi:MAG: ATP-binding protein [Clostridia bacterium]|nr:ATP-binding protein [Clostridia bacterium]